MKKLTFTLASVAALVSAPALAADLGRPMTKAPAYVAAPMMLWNGFYIGAHVGYGWGDTRMSDFFGPIPGAPRPEGIFGGGQIGYNFQFSPNWVFGIEADISGADIEDERSIYGLPNDTRSRLDLFGTVRGRIGYAFNNVMIYGTGGFAWGDNSISVAGFGSDRQTHFGWTAGGGLEYAFSPNWSAKVEYLYLDLDRESYAVGPAAPISARLDLHTVKFGINYRFNWGGGPVVANY